MTRAMSDRVAFLFFARCAALGLACSACHFPSAAERAAAPIVEKSVEARGGRVAWRKVKSLTFSGSLDAGTPHDPVKRALAAVAAQRPGSGLRPQARAALRRREAEAEKPVELPFLLELSRPHRSRLEITFQGQVAVQVFDGAQGRKLRPFLGRSEVEPYSEEELRLAGEEAELDGLLLDAAAKGHRIELEGTEPLEGKQAHRLAVTLAPGHVRHVWVDAESFLEVRTDGSRKLGGKLRPIWTSLRDYRSVDGLLIPHLLETSAEGLGTTERIVVQKVAVNLPIDDARFTKP